MDGGTPVLPLAVGLFTKLKFGWSDHAVGPSFAYSGFTMAMAQVFVTRRLIPKVGERRAILLGLSIGIAGFLGNGLVPHRWMTYPVLTCGAFEGLVFPSMNSTMSRAVPPDQQGELQGGVSSLQSAAAIVGPPLMTAVFAAFSKPGVPVQFPGAAFMLAALLSLCALLVMLALARGPFGDHPRPDEHILHRVNS